MRPMAAVMPVSLAQSFIRDGKVKALGVTSRNRWPSLPNVPAIAETAGLQKVDEDSWYGLLAPAGTPAPALDRLTAALRDTLKDPAIIEKMNNGGLKPMVLERAAFGTLLQPLVVLSLLVLLGLFYGLAWLPWDGRQAVLFDLPARQFFIFELTIWPQDLWLLGWLLIIAAFALCAIDCSVAETAFTESGVPALSAPRASAVDEGGVGKDWNCNARALSAALT